MHSKNPYGTRKPDFVALGLKYPDFQRFVNVSAEGHASINFQDASALRALTRCLLKDDWKLDVELREDRLCPTIPNRLDYLLHVLDLEPFLRRRDGQEPDGGNAGQALRVLDMQALRQILTQADEIRGTGSIAVYPMLLHRLRPAARIIATGPSTPPAYLSIADSSMEIDPVSFSHAQAVFQANSIPTTTIDILCPSAEDKVLFPLFQESSDGANIVICNPPFFSSKEDMRASQALKADGAPAAPTANVNELITFGGEVTFVSRMIKESLELKDRCQWYTSLIGRFASLQPLIDLLKRSSVDNYFIKTIKPARTVRWILAWSHTAIRIPDEITRAEPIYPNTAFSRLAPLPNTVSHCPVHPALSVEQLQSAVRPVLESIQLTPAPYAPPAQPSSGFPPDHELGISGEQADGSILLAPIANTWSRAARRLAARAVPECTGQPYPEILLPTPNPVPPSPIFRARLSFVSPAPPSANLVEQPLAHQDWRGGTLRLDWTYGGDRGALEGFWKFLLTKAGLLGSQSVARGVPSGEGQQVRDEGAGVEEEGGGRGGGRGGRYGMHGPRGKRGRHT